MAWALENVFHYEPSFSNLEKAGFLGAQLWVWDPLHQVQTERGSTLVTWHSLGQQARVPLEPKGLKTLQNSGSLRGNYGSVPGEQASLRTSQFHLEPPMLLLSWPRSLLGLRSTGPKLKALFPFWRNIKAIYDNQAQDLCLRPRRPEYTLFDHLSAPYKHPETGKAGIKLCLIKKIRSSP